MLATIGYEKADLEDFVATLCAAKVEVLVDVRERAQSRRKGFSKTALSEKLAASGIEYVHFRSLGDPKEGRDAARAGDMRKFRRVFSRVMRTEGAKSALAEIEVLAKRQSICLMCYERDYRECHRKIISDYLESRLEMKARHLGVQKSESLQSSKRRVLYSCESAAA